MNKKIKLVVASNNIGKIEEFKAMLKGYKIITLDEAGIKINAEETGETFSENAKIKAREVAKYTNEIVLADDSGLSIKSLNGFPGVKTHRVLGREATDEEINEYILKKLEGKENEEREAEVITCIAIIKDNKEYVVTGTLEGKIPKEPRGKKGFGFDSIFETKFGTTLAEMSASKKNRISSRRKALIKVKRLNIL